jgi:hypothetical protein
MASMTGRQATAVPRARPNDLGDLLDRERGPAVSGQAPRRPDEKPRAGSPQDPRNAEPLARNNDL